MIAEAGDAVTDEAGNVICYVKKDLLKHGIVSASDFHRFADGEMPWLYGQRLDHRCIRAIPDAYGLQICINGEWRR